jgi:hypothetical protein
MVSFKIVADMGALRTASPESLSRFLKSDTPEELLEINFFEYTPAASATGAGEVRIGLRLRDDGHGLRAA